MSGGAGAADRAADRGAAFPRAFWYPAAASARLTDKPIAAQVLDWPLALFRDAWRSAAPTTA